MEHSLDKKKNPEDVFLWIFCGLFLALTCWLISGNYFSLDEPNLLWEIRKNMAGKTLFHKYISEGRPIDGLITIGLQAMIGTLEGLRYMRMLNVLLVFLFCLQVFSQLEKTRIGRQYAFLLSAMIFCLPAFSVFICWAECTSLLFSAILSFYAGTLALQALGKHIGMPEPGLRKERLYLAGAILLQLVSLMDYQSLALAFVLPIFFRLLIVENIPSRNKIWFAFIFSSVFFASIFIYMKCYDFLLSTLHVQKVARGGFTHSPLQKLPWYGEILSEASKLHLLLLKNTYIPRLFSCLLLLAIGRDLYKKRFTDLFFLLGSCTLVFFPHLLIEDSWGASRNFALISILFSFYLVLRFSELFNLRSYVLTATVSLFFVTFLCINIQEGWARPQESDRAHLAAFIQGLPELKSEKMRIDVGLPAWNMHEKHSALKAYFDEFNDPVFFRSWAVDPAIKVMYQDRYPALQASKIDSCLIISIRDKFAAFGGQTEPAHYCLDLNYQ
jgi:hypothetical protein